VPKFDEKSKNWNLEDEVITKGSLDELEAEVKLKENTAEWKAIGQSMAEEVMAGLGGGIDITTILKPPTNADTVTKDVAIPAVGINTYLIPPSNTVGSQPSSNTAGSHSNKFTG